MRKEQLSLADGAAPAVSDFSLCSDALLKSVQESLSAPALTNPMPEGRPTLVSAWGVNTWCTFGGGVQTVWSLRAFCDLCAFFFDAPQ